MEYDSMLLLLYAISVQPFPDGLSIVSSCRRMAVIKSIQHGQVVPKLTYIIGWMND